MNGLLVNNKGILANRVFYAVLAAALFVSGAVLASLFIPPVANAGNDKLVDLGESVAFDSSASTGASEYFWYFRDDGNATGMYASHVYHKEGIYEVALVVKSSQGMFATDIVRVTVTNQIPVPNAGLDVNIAEDEIINFNGTASDTPNDIPSLIYNWDFGDGYSSNGKLAAHSYRHAGIYTAILSVEDHNGAIGHDTKLITVSNVAPTANAGSNKSITEGSAIILDGTGSTDTYSDTNGLRYEWDTGTKGPITQVRHADNGVYYHTLTVIDDNGAFISDIAKVTVLNVPPIVSISGVSVCANFTLQATGEKYHDVELILASGGIEQSLVSVYRVPGNPNEQSRTANNISFDLTKKYWAVVRYTPEDDPINGQPNGATPVILTISFEDGSHEVLNHNFNVNHPDTWNWTVDINEQVSTHNITYEGRFYDPGSDDLQTVWDFGDGTPIITSHISNGTAPVYFTETVKHSCESTGTYNLTLKAIDDDGGIGEYVTRLTGPNAGLNVGGIAPAVIANASLYCIKDASMQYSVNQHYANQNESLINYSWDFGDGYIMNGTNVTHEYAFAGEYRVLVKATDDSLAVGFDIVKIVVNNSAPFADVAQSRAANSDSLLLFSATGYDTESDVNFLTYKWEFGDGAIAYGNSQEHTYDAPGVYLAKLTVSDPDGATTQYPIAVQINNTSPAVQISNHVVYGNAQDITIRPSVTDTKSDILALSCAWSFGDGHSGTGMNGTHKYTSSGTYSVSLTVTDPHGASGVAYASVEVAVDNDGDSLTNEYEQTTSHTNSNDPDSDDDYIPDYWEIYTYGTDPLKADADGDTLSDWYEVSFIGYLPSSDVDGDGLTLPFDADSDNDLLPDNVDNEPLTFDACQGVPFVYDAITANATLGAVVAIDYNESVNAPLQIVSFVPPSEIGGHVGNYFDIPVPAHNYSKVCVKLQYPSDSTGVIEENLRMYSMPAGSNNWHYLENSGVDPANDYIWDVSTRITGDGRGGGNDGDNDTLDDVWETNTGVFVSTTNTGTNPNDPDSDNDGLNDSEEIFGNLGGDDFRYWSDVQDKVSTGGNEAQGGGLALADIDNNGKLDGLFMSVDAPSGDNHYRYKVAYDLEPSTGVFARWGNTKLDHQVGSSENQGGAVAFADLDGNGVLDVLFMAIDHPAGDNNYRYKIAWNINSTGDFQSWSGTKGYKSVGSSENQGAGVAFADIDGNGQLDALFMAIDNPDGENNYRYKVAWNINSTGDFQSWSPTKGYQSAGGHETAGGGVGFAYINDNTQLDAIFMSVVNDEGENSYKFRIAYDINSTGDFASWSDVKGRIFVGGANSQGGGLITMLPNGTALDVDRNGIKDTIFMHVDNPSGSNNYRYKIAYDFNMLDPNDYDTDSDGLYDGWNDNVTNGVWDSCERCGEVGDPRHQDAQGRNCGSIATLINNTDHNPHPLVKDIYVEVDHMGAGGALDFCGGHSLSNAARDEVIAAFKRHAIYLHVDDGCMGGMNELAHQNVLSSPWEETYQSNPRYFNPNRLHIFHYALIAHKVSIDGSEDRSGCGGGDSFTIAEDVIPGWPEYDYDTALAGTFMHELGHTLGLGYQDGVNHGDGCPSGYKSCMNYDYQFELVDYHGGGGGYYNDWDNIDYVI